MIRNRGRYVTKRCSNEGLRGRRYHREVLDSKAKKKYVYVFRGSSTATFLRWNPTLWEQERKYLGKNLLSTPYRSFWGINFECSVSKTSL